MWQQLKQLAKHSAIYGLGNIATSVLSFLLVPFYTHYLTTADFGAYSLLMTVYGLGGMLVDCGLTSSLGRYYFNDLKEMDEAGQAEYRQRLITTGLWSSTGVALVLSTLSYFCAVPVANHLMKDPAYALENAQCIRLMAVALFFRGLTVTPLVYLRVTERPLPYALLTALQLALFLLLNIVLLTTFRLGVLGVFYSLVFSTVVYAALLILAVRSDLKGGWDGALAKELFRYGVPFLPVLLTVWVMDLSDRYLLGLYASLSEVGIYSLGYKFGQCMTFVVTAFTLGWVPIRYKLLTLDEPQIIYGRVATFFVAGAGWVWLLLALFAPEIVALTAPAEFQRAAGFIAPVAMAYLIYGLFVLSVTGLGVSKEAKGVPTISVCAAALNIGLNLLFLPRYGAIAAAYSTIVAYVVLTLGGLWLSHRVYPVAYQYGKCAVLIAGMLCLSAGAHLSGAPLLIVALKLFLTVLYWALVIGVGVFQRAELAKGLGLLSRFAPGPLRAVLGRAAASLKPAGAVSPAPKAP